MNNYLRETSRRIASKIVTVLYEWLVSQPDSTEEWARLRIPERSMHLMQPCCLNRGSVFLGPQWDCSGAQSLSQQRVFSKVHTASSVFQFGPTLVLWLGTSEKTWSYFLLPLHFRFISLPLGFILLPFHHYHLFRYLH